ncbi:MAG: fibronectin type III domain-containing protein [Flavobacteriia bacterium]|nr:fibronectin type III domain-containing protein [Flavobacteriia bacterium]OJX40140.1 MAG: hypothetical protein BGO87_00240 [Flavobacteriia bacterium 40-80]
MKKTVLSLMLALPLLVKAQCPAASAINDSFESYAAGSGQGMPTCWALEGSSGGMGPTIGLRNSAGEARTGSNYIQIYSFFSSNPTNYFITPELTAIDGYHYARFYLKSDDAGAMTVTYGTMDSQSNTASFNALGTATLTNNQYVEVNTGAIPATAHKYFALKIEISGMHKTIKLDDFEWGALAVPCNEVTNLISSNVTKNTAKVSWNGQAGDQFKVEYGPVGFTPGNGTSQTILATEINLTNLSEGTAYDVYVTTVCQNGNSTTSPKVTFTTTVCSEASNTLASQITKNAAVISWAVQVGNQFKVEYGMSGFAPGNGISQTVTTNQINLTNLNENTDYDVYITTICGSETSNNAVKVSFKTLNTLAAMIAEGKSPFTVYPNPSDGTIISLVTEEDLSDYHYAVYTVEGKQAIENSLNQIIDVSQLESGAYLLVIRNRSNSFTHPILIQK